MLNLELTLLRVQLVLTERNGQTGIVAIKVHTTIEIVALTVTRRSKREVTLTTFSCKCRSRVYPISPRQRNEGTETILRATVWCRVLCISNDKCVTVDIFEIDGCGIVSDDNLSRGFSVFKSYRFGHVEFRGAGSILTVLQIDSQFTYRVHTLNGDNETGSIHVQFACSGIKRLLTKEHLSIA